MGGGSKGEKLTNERKKKKKNNNNEINIADNEQNKIDHNV